MQSLIEELSSALKEEPNCEDTSDDEDIDYVEEINSDDEPAADDNNDIELYGGNISSKKTTKMALLTLLIAPPVIYGLQLSLASIDLTLVLLQILDRVGDKLAALAQAKRHTRIPSNLGAASIIEDAGFDVKPQLIYRDDINHRKWADKYRSKIFETPVNGSEKTALQNLAALKWLKDIGSSGSADKSDSSYLLVYPLFVEARPEMNMP